MQESNISIENRLTILETNITNVTKEISELTQIVKDQHKLFVESSQLVNHHIESLSKDIIQAQTPNWQTFLMYLGTIASVGIILFSVIYNSIGMTNLTIERNQLEANLNNKVLELSIKNDILNGSLISPNVSKSVAGT